MILTTETLQHRAKLKDQKSQLAFQQFQPLPWSGQHLQQPG